MTYGGVANSEATTYIALTTTLAAGAGAVVAMLVAWGMFGKPDVTMALNGVLAGLVSITANCDQVSPTSALIIGAIGGVLVVVGIVLLDKLKIDDQLAHGPYMVFVYLGGIATGIFGTALPEVGEEVLVGVVISMSSCTLPVIISVGFHNDVCFVLRTENCWHATCVTRRGRNGT